MFSLFTYAQSNLHLVRRKATDKKVTLHVEHLIYKYTYANSTQPPSLREEKLTNNNIRILRITETLQMLPYFKPGVELEVAEQIKHNHCSETLSKCHLLLCTNNTSVNSSSYSI